MRRLEKRDEGETGASSREVMKLEGDVMRMAQGQETTRAGSEADCSGQQLVPGLVGSLTGVLFRCP